MGTPNAFGLTALLSATPLRAIVVCPAYRLNLFGFLASRELSAEDAALHRDGDIDSCSGSGASGNYGLWDQRAALTWTYTNISYFGGRASAITVGGYSAGAHAAFHQLVHDLLPPSTPPSPSSSFPASPPSRFPRPQLIRRVIMFSNGPGLPARTPSQSQPQFDALLSACGIPLSLPASAKLARLRALPAAALLAAASTLPTSLTEFRASAGSSGGDGGAASGDFVPCNLFPRIRAGALAAAMRAAGVRLVLGECSAEHHVYARYRPPPASGGPRALQARLEADFARAPLRALLRRHYGGADAAAFGQVYADLQIHALQRGLASCLAGGGEAGAAPLVRRYRVEWASAGAAATPAAWGATHGSDMVVWFFGNGKVLSAGDEAVVRRFAGPVWRFICGSEGGERDEWGTGDDVRRVRRLKADGQVDVWQDEGWEAGMHAWRVLGEARADEDEDEARAKL